MDPDTCLMAPVAGWALHSDAVTGVGWHPTRDILATSTGQSIRVPVEGISFRSRSAGGVKVFNTREGETVVSVAWIADQGDEAEPEPEA